MRYVPAGLLGLFVSSVLLTSIASAASVKDDAAKQTVEIPTNWFLKLREGEYQAHQLKTKHINASSNQTHPAEKTHSNLTPSIISARAKRELEWQLKLDALSEKLRLARELFGSTAVTSFDFDLLQSNSLVEPPKLPGITVPN